MIASSKRRLVLAAALSALALQPALAGTDTDTLTVSVTVQEVCTIGGSTLDFGTYVGGQQADLNGQGQIAYSGCAAGTLSIAFDGGGSGNVAARRMSGSNGGTLGYQLFRNSARTQVWGTGAEAQQVQLLVGGAGSVPVYGRIPGGQAAAAGSYTDTINITLTF